MIISRTPFRLSFFGGGTDYPIWYRKHGGSVLSTTIDKYCYIFCRKSPAYQTYRYRIVWSRIELCQSFEEITHPVVREAIKLTGVTCPLELHHASDLPSRSGIGSSSAFTVGVLSAILRLQNIFVSRRQLALHSLHLEQEILKECVGSQDQVASVFGGLNKIDFVHGDIEDFRITPITLTSNRLVELNQRLMLFYTGVVRTASDIASSYVFQDDVMARMRLMVEQGTNILVNGDLDDFGLMLDEAWQLKRELSSKVSNHELDDLYTYAKTLGALGGKIPGAGGGGFILLFVNQENRQAVLSGLSKLTHVPFKFDSSGSTIVHNSNGGEATYDTCE